MNLLDTIIASQLDAANKVLAFEVADRTLRLNALEQPIDDETVKRSPSIQTIREVSIGTLKTQIRAIRRSIRLNSYLIEQLNKQKDV